MNLQSLPLIRYANQRLFECFEYLSHVIEPGISGRDIEEIVKSLLEKKGLQPGLLGYRGFPAVCSISANNVAVHGVPNDTPFERLDLCTIDIVGCMHGLYVDGAWTYLVRKKNEPLHDQLADDELALKLRLLSVAWKTSILSVRTAITGKTLSDISLTAVDTARYYKFDILPGCYGHGIGENLHQPPHIPFSPKDPLFSEAKLHRIPQNSVLNIEPVLISRRQENPHELTVGEDGWSISTRPSALSAQFEFSVWTGEQGNKKNPGELVSLPGYSVFNDTLLKHPLFF